MVARLATFTAGVTVPGATVLEHVRLAMEHLDAAGLPVADQCAVLDVCEAQLNLCRECGGAGVLEARAGASSVATEPETTPCAACGGRDE